MSHCIDVYLLKNFNRIKKISDPETIKLSHLRSTGHLLDPLLTTLPEKKVQGVYTLSPVKGCSNYSVPLLPSDVLEFDCRNIHFNIGNSFVLVVIPTT